VKVTLIFVIGPGKLKISIEDQKDLVVCQGTLVGLKSRTVKYGLKGVEGPVFACIAKVSGPKDSERNI